MNEYVILCADSKNTTGDGNSSVSAGQQGTGQCASLRHEATGFSVSAS